MLIASRRVDAQVGRPAAVLGPRKVLEQAVGCGVRAESLSRTIRTLADDGLIDVSGHRAWILDMDRLVAEVAPPHLH